MDDRNYNISDDVYVIGCGPSLKDFDWEQIRSKSTIAINGAIKFVPKPSYFLTADSVYARCAAVNNFWGCACCKVLVMREDHKFFHRVEPFLKQYDWHIKPTRFDGQIYVNGNGFCTGQNSGFCGMQLAIILGAKRIHLLGMDLHHNGGSNFHAQYRSGVTHLTEYFGHFVTALEKIKEAGLEVISHSPTSKLNEYIEYRKEID